MNLDDEPDEPTPPTLDPLLFTIDENTTLHVQFDIDGLMLTVTKGAHNLTLEVSGILEMDGILDLHEKILKPILMHGATVEKFKAAQAERDRIRYEREAIQRAQEKKERDRAQTFRGVSTARMVTPTVTVHGRECVSLEFARKRQTIGTVIYALTPDDLIGKLDTAMTGRLNMYFCSKCEPIPDRKRHNSEMGGGLPMDEPVSALRARIETSIWEAHHAALARYDERNPE